MSIGGEFGNAVMFAVGNGAADEPFKLALIDVRLKRLGIGTWVAVAGIWLGELLVVIMLSPILLQGLGVLLDVVAEPRREGVPEREVGSKAKLMIVAECVPGALSMLLELEVHSKHYVTVR